MITKGTSVATVGGTIRFIGENNGITTPEGKTYSILRFIVGYEKISRNGKPYTVKFGVTMIGKKAVEISESLSNGTYVIVSGELSLYTPQNNTNEKSSPMMQINADTISVLLSPEKNQQEHEESRPKSRSCGQPNRQNSEHDDDVPF